MLVELVISFPTVSLIICGSFRHFVKTQVDPEKFTNKLFFVMLFTFQFFSQWYIFINPLFGFIGCCFKLRCFIHFYYIFFYLKATISKDNLVIFLSDVWSQMKELLNDKNIWFCKKSNYFSNLQNLQFKFKASNEKATTNTRRCNIFLLPQNIFALYQVERVKFQTI